MSKNLSAPNWEESWERTLNVGKRPNNPYFRASHHVYVLKVFFMKLLDYIELRYATTIPFFYASLCHHFFIYKDRVLFSIYSIYIYIIVIKCYILNEGYLCHLIKYVCLSFLSFSSHFHLYQTTKHSSHILPSFYSLSFLQQYFFLLSLFLLSLIIQTKSKVWASKNNYSPVVLLSTTLLKNKFPYALSLWYHAFHRRHSVRLSFSSFLTWFPFPLLLSCFRPIRIGSSCFWC